jgi:hypothetical protein
MVMLHDTANMSSQTSARTSRKEAVRHRKAEPALHDAPEFCDSMAAWRTTQVWADLVTSFEHFDLADIEHLVANREHLVSNTYNDGHGGRCLFGWLSARHDEPIDSREALTRYFTGSSGYPACEEPVYQPPRWLVRLIDGAICENVRARYPGISTLPWDVVIACAREHLAKRRGV